MIVELIPTEKDQPIVRLKLFKNSGKTYNPVQISMQQGYVEVTSMTSLENLDYLVHMLKEQLKNVESKTQE